MFDQNKKERIKNNDITQSFISSLIQSNNGGSTIFRDPFKFPASPPVHCVRSDKYAVYIALTVMPLNVLYTV